MRLASSVFASASQTAGRPRWVKRLGRGLVTAGSLYSAVCLAAWLLYPRLLYPAPRRAVVAPEELPPGCEELTLPAEAGAPPVRALRWRAAGASLPTLVWFHGNGEIVDDLLPLGALYASEGLGFVAMEYRGYGRSAGSKATELGLYADAERLLRALEREREERSARGESTSGPLVVVGYSLGSAIAAELGARGRGDRYVLVAAFTSITDVASRIAPILPARLILSERFDTLAKAPHLRSPLLIHGADDELVPIDMGRAVAAASGARFVAVPSGRHGTVLVVGGGAALREISTFARAAVRAAP
ncbi:MAG: alpha/beta hydrolase [Myxococcales bacterium]|nr:alpha/beta hydrolase [Myxococcales bacterium]MBL0196844.1 alpha/beta hydrolase [Myxococcales bacterium]HQY63835.1 alpha/beta hydrolase [Polyangiaceae bacterium]